MKQLNGYALFLVCYFAYALALLPVVIIATGSFDYQGAEAVEFVPRPKDRPILETPQQVWQARTTGVSEFDFDGTHYVITNLPKHYVDYSSWYVRMP